MHYYKFNIGDYARSTRHLTNDEDLAYRRLLDMYYETESPIPLETQWVARRIRMDVNDVEILLNDMFIRSDEGWRHPRCDADIAEYHRQSDRNRENGKRGGRPKSAEKQILQNPVGSESVSSGNPVVTLTTNHKPLTTNHKPNNIRRELPECIPLDAWQGWVELRNQRNKPLTDRTYNKAVDKLVAFVAKGHDITEILDRSTMNGWLDLYELKETRNAGSISKSTTEPTNNMVRAVLASQARRAADGERSPDDWPEIR
jgi:uncharacterized protein YdaU (DUF1376 family)